MAIPQISRKQQQTIWIGTSAMTGLLKHRTDFRAPLSASARTARTTVLVCTVIAALPSAASPPLISFNKDIRPLLTETCFVCHGPDANKRAGGFRIDQRESAVAKGVLVPGKPEKSLAIRRIMASASAGVMPPTGFSKRLTQEQKLLLKRWIAEGAKYQPHWAFVPPPTTVPLPSIKNSAWCRNPIDRFVLARLEKEGVSCSAPASKTDWIRRVTLDLTGLLPTTAERDAFVADRTSSAFEKVVDRLLASPRYGERMAAPWLDVARYADSYGYQSDQLSPTWPYRDWVISAFNKNLSYDKFVSWQIAGDLLPNATTEQRLATAFNRLHRMTNEGGSVPEEWRMEGVADRVRTLGTAFLGLTLECTRCHDHKYDPITTRDFYSFASFLNNIDEYGMYDRSDIVPSPSLLLPTSDQSVRLSAATTLAAKSATDLDKAASNSDAEFKAWLNSKPVPTRPGMKGLFHLDHFENNQIVNAAPGAKEPGGHSDEVKFVPGPKPGLMAALLDGENNINFPSLGKFTRHTPYTIAFWMKDPRLADGAAVVYTATDGTDAGPFGYDLMVQDGILTARMFRHWPGNAIATRTKTAIPKDAWTHVAVTYDGSSRGAGLVIYINGARADQFILRDKMVKGTGVHNLVFGQRFRDRGFKGGAVAELAIFNRQCSPLEISDVVTGHAINDALADPGAHEKELREYWQLAISPELQSARTALADARQQIWLAEDPQAEVAVMDEMPGIRPTFVLARGRYDAPQNDSTRVLRSVPASLPPIPAGVKLDRLALANWFVAANHPLTSRVAVNRLWAIMFGKGIVETAEDFGLQGKPPTNPELLDWLARDFVSGNWNVKALMRQIALSSTYRQASAVRLDLKDRDPRNDLLARGPSQRLGAEAIRDTALQAAGLLDLKMGGPPVSPYQPGDLWRESNTMSPGYQQSIGTDLYRRSVYTVVKRTAPMPNMLAFDTTSREFCVARRQPTNTPIQALVLLNDPQFVEASREVASRALKSTSSPAAQISEIFRRLAVREPTAREQELLLALYKRQHEEYSATPDAASLLVHVGDSKPDSTMNFVDLAAATVVAQAVVNLDAVTWNR